MDSDASLEQVMSQLGDFGKYQFRQHVLHLLSGFLAGVHMLSLTVVAPTPGHRCFIDELDGRTDLHSFNDAESSYGYFNESTLSKYIPYSKKDGTKLDSCHRFDASTHEVVSCASNIYDTSIYQTSRVIEYDLVCDNRWQRAIIQTIYMFGVLMGAIILGSLADKYGRKTIFCISGVGQLVLGLAGPFITNFIAYCGSLFFYGMFGSGGAYVTGFVLTMELIGGSRRTLCGTLFSFAFAVGVMLVAFWAYFITDVKTLQIVLALHSLLLLGHWWLIDESIRWLWGTGRREEAIRIVEKGVKINGKIPVDLKDLQKKDTNVANGNGNVLEKEETKTATDAAERTYGAGDLFKKPVMRSRTLTVAFLWFTNSLVYYGLSLNTGSLDGNPFLILFLIGLAEVPGYLIVICFVDKTGRRFLESALLFIGGAMCLVVAFLTPGTLVTGLVMIGKLAIAGSFAIIYNYTAELFPTVVRNSAVGIGACSARFSGMLTPLIGLLDTLGTQVPTLIFGSVALVAAVLSLLLPETLNKIMPQTLEDGECFGVGDTGFRTCLNCVSGRKGNGRHSANDNNENGEPLNNGTVKV